MKKTVSIPVRDIGIPDGCCFSVIFRTDQNGFSGQKEITDSVRNGALRIELGPQTAEIMILQQGE